MPICKLECQPDEVPTAIEICNQALDLNLAGLEIDKLNPKDREYRILAGQNIGLNIDLTVKGFEYGKENGIFDPPPEQIQSTAQMIANTLKRPTTITTWANSAFVMRESGQKPIPQPEKVDIQIPFGQIGIPQITLTISPKAIASNNTRNEMEPSSESPFDGIRLQIEKFLMDTLLLPETLKSLVALQIALAAETDIALDMKLDQDCLDENQRGFLATSLLHLLDTNPSTKNDVATIWVRQGKPDYSIAAFPK